MSLWHRSLIAPDQTTFMTDDSCAGTLLSSLPPPGIYRVACVPLSQYPGDNHGLVSPSWDLLSTAGVVDVPSTESPLHYLDECLHLLLPFPGKRKRALVRIQVSTVKLDDDISEISCALCYIPARKRANSIINLLLVLYKTFHAYVSVTLCNKFPAPLISSSHCSARYLQGSFSQNTLIMYPRYGVLLSNSVRSNDTVITATHVTVTEIMTTFRYH